MKNLLYVLIIVGLVASIGGILIVFKELNKTVSNKTAVEAKLDEAVRNLQSAEAQRNNALKVKNDAEIQVLEFQKKLQQLQSEADKSASVSKEFLAEKASLLQVSREAQAELEKAKAELKLTEDRVDQALKEKQELEARRQVEASDKEIALSNLEKERKLRESTELDYRKLANVAKVSESVARFCSEVMSNVFVAINSGNIHYVNACKTWNEARGRQDRILALTTFQKARGYYNTALSYVPRLDDVNKDTDKIKSQLKKAVDDNIASSDTMIELLNKVIDGDSDMTSEERGFKSTSAVKSKYAADTAVLDICSQILAQMDTYREVFTRTQRINLEDTKRELEKKLKSPATVQPGH